MSFIDILIRVYHSIFVDKYNNNYDKFILVILLGVLGCIAFVRIAVNAVDMVVDVVVVVACISIIIMAISSMFDDHFYLFFNDNCL